MTIDTSIIEALYGNAPDIQGTSLTGAPTPVLPVVSQSDVQDGFLTRYFLRGSGASMSIIMEIDSKQYEQFKDNSRYNVVSVKWKIVGNPYTTMNQNGIVDRGVEDFNKEQVRKADMTFGGLVVYIRDYLQFWYSDNQGNLSYTRIGQILNPKKRP